jgi:hydrogenase nickel incorporation protein HypA/HybF
MHELSVALSILDLAEEEAMRHEGRVVAIHVRLGPLSGVIKPALVSAYDLARETTSLAGAALVVEEVPLVAHCPTCAVDRTLEAINAFCCPVCGTATGEIIRGRELEIVALEIEP